MTILVVHRGDQEGADRWLLLGVEIWDQLLNKKPSAGGYAEGLDARTLRFSSPYGNRTRVSSVKGTCPNP